MCAAWTSPAVNPMSHKGQNAPEKKSKKRLQSQDFPSSHHIWVYRLRLAKPFPIGQISETALSDVFETTPSSFHWILSNHNFFVDVLQQMRRSGNREENKRIIMDLETVLKSHSCPYIVHCYGIFITEVCALYDYRIWLSLCIYRYMTIVS